MKVLVFHLPTSWISGFCDTPIWQFSGHAGAKTNIHKGSDYFKIAWNWERVMVVPLIWTNNISVLVGLTYK